jgi:hypothetical protein
MMATDDFGRDPSVRNMRQVFARMEKVQAGLLEQAALSRFDRRLRVWRETALRSFEEAWAGAAARGLAATGSDVADLYIMCFARVLEKGGIMAPREALPGDEALRRFVREVIP